jgi:hypothetical protein
MSPVVRSSASLMYRRATSRLTHSRLHEGRRKPSAPSALPRARAAGQRQQREHPGRDNRADTDSRPPRRQRAQRQNRGPAPNEHAAEAGAARPSGAYAVRDQGRLDRAMTGERPHLSHLYNTRECHVETSKKGAKGDPASEVGSIEAGFQYRPGPIPRQAPRRPCKTLDPGDAASGLIWSLTGYTQNAMSRTGTSRTSSGFG